MKSKADSTFGKCEVCGHKRVLHPVDTLMNITVHWCKSCIDECDARKGTFDFEYKCTCEHDVSILGHYEHCPTRQEASNVVRATGCSAACNLCGTVIETNKGWDVPTHGPTLFTCDSCYTVLIHAFPVADTACNCSVCIPR